MKLKYLGDKKDCFKWDYLNFLMSKLEYSWLTVVSMMTSESSDAHGSTIPEKFKPNDDRIIEFCKELIKVKEARVKETKNDDKKALEKFVCLLKTLPQKMGKAYQIDFHRASQFFEKNNRKKYFSDLTQNKKQIVFVDPDTGFEPNSCGVEHIAYSEVEQILQQCSDEAIVVVFQHPKQRQPRGKFGDRFNEIKKKLESKYHLTAVFWEVQLMFVCIAKNKDILNKLVKFNEEYAGSEEDMGVV